MVLPRSSALRASSLLNVTRGARTARSELQPWRRIAQRGGRRGYASGHGEQEGSSVPWAIGAVAISIPSCWFLLKDPHARHFPPLGPSIHGKEAHHGDHDEEGHEEGGEEAEEAPKEAPEGEESKEESSEEQPKEDSGDEKSEDKPQEEPKEEGKSDDTKDSGEKKDGSAPKPLSGTRKTEEDAKGGTKVRVDSNARKEVSPGESDPNASGSKKDSVSDSKEE